MGVVPANAGDNFSGLLDLREKRKGGLKHEVGLSLPAYMVITSAARRVLPLVCS